MIDSRPHQTSASECNPTSETHARRNARKSGDAWYTANGSEASKHLKARMFIWTLETNSSGHQIQQATMRSVTRQTGAEVKHRFIIIWCKNKPCVKRNFCLSFQSEYLPVVLLFTKRSVTKSSFDGVKAESRSKGSLKMSWLMFPCFVLC